MNKGVRSTAELDPQSDPPRDLSAGLRERVAKAIFNASVKAAGRSVLWDRDGDSWPPHSVRDEARACADAAIALVDRLRGNAPSIPAMRDAADEIERLRRAVDPPPQKHAPFIYLTTALAMGGAELIETAGAIKALKGAAQGFSWELKRVREEVAKLNTALEAYDHATKGEVS